MTLKVGSRLPPVEVSRLKDGLPEGVDLRRHLAGQRAVIVGVPGAFTPVCTAEHVPGFIAQADALERSGYSRVICVTANDPWVTDQWARMVDPGSRIEFLSDGNYSLARGLGAMVSAADLFMSERPTRYLLITDDGAVERLRLERTPFALTCTRANDALAGPPQTQTVTLD